MREKAYFHLPGLFEFYELYRMFLPLFREHREYFYDWCEIGSIYGAPADCIWGGGRAGFGENDPEEVLWQWGILHVTEEGLKLAGRMAIRLTYLVIGSSLMTLTTTPNQLTDGLERLLRPLNKLHVPIHEIAMMMSIALRFIPILMEETDKIMKAQIARGADFETGNIIQKAKNMIPLLVPLFISAFRRANDLAMAMEARCYHGGDNRTQMKPLRYESRDYISYVVMWAYLGIAIVFRIVGI